MRAARNVVLALTLTALGLLAAVQRAGAQRRSAGRPTPTPALVKPSGDPWKEVDGLVSDRKLEEASKKVKAILAAARARGDAGEIARALAREAQLRLALGGYETAVTFLRSEAWPEEPMARVVLDLAYASTLVTYEESYSWEIAKRETVSSALPPDLTAWTKAQIFAEAERAYADAWGRREALGKEPVARLERIVQANDYPAGVRGTVRDALTYLFVELLADTRGWKAGQQDDLYTLDLASLCVPSGARRAARPDDTAIHPLVRIAALLDDLETWHAGAGEREAALEARLERLRRLHEATSNPEDRATVRTALVKALPEWRDVSWWAMGQAQLADFVRQENASDAFVKARKLALEGVEAYPASPGGQRCRAIAGEIEAPDVQLESMASDAAGKRSVRVVHKNLPALFFRAYAIDLPKRIASARDYNLLPGGQELQTILSSRKADAEWRVDLPGTPDFRTHATYVVPPLARKGFYVVMASARQDFGRTKNRVLSTGLLVSDLVLLVRQTNEGGIQATAVSGGDGRPVPGASVALWSFDWQKGHRPEETKESDANGDVAFAFSGERAARAHFLLGRRGDDLALDASYLGFARPHEPPETSAALVYTDRSVYRPGQKLYWKVVAYGGKSDAGSFHVLAQRSLTVTLRDANGQEAASSTATTDSWGSAWGEMTVPAGRVLGAWRLQSSINGSAALRVEEYKRPTFEASFREPQEALRLNREARLVGEAKYYFGLPVTGGRVRWRVERRVVRPWFWEWMWGWRPELPQPRTIAAGSTTLKDDGTFALAFTAAADERTASEKGISFSFVVNAEVTDDGGETRNASRTFRLGTVAVEARISMDEGFFRAGEPAELSVVRSDLDGTPRAGAGTWRLVRLRQPEQAALPSEEPAEPDPGFPPGAFRTPGDGESPRWRHLDPPERILARWKEGAEAEHGAVEHDEKGSATVALGKLAAGPYRLLYETKDPWGAVYRAQRDFMVAAKKGALALPLALVAESTSVKVGNTARLLATSGLPGQLLFLDIYRGGKLAERRRLQAGSDATLVEIPVRESDRGGFGVMLTAVRDHQAMQQQAAVFVPWDDKELKVSFATFRDTLRPGAKETFRVTVTPAVPGRPAPAAQLLAYMYDRSLDLFAPHTPPSVAAIYPNRAGVGWLRASLGNAMVQWVFSEDFPGSFSYPTFSPDRIKYEPGYDIGGPGVRGGMPYRARGGMVAAQMAAPAAAPRVMAETKSLDAAAEVRLKKNEVGRSEAPAAPPAAPQGEEPLRSNFAETAFFLPNVLTAPDGSAALEFAVPDSVTSWKLWVHAFTRDLAGGSAMKELRTVKELMVRPYVPRFLRQGDRAEVRVVVNDAGKQPLDGTLTLDVIDPATGASLAKDFGLDAAARPFHVAAGAGTTLTFPLDAPRRLGTVAFKAVATAGEFSDGEVRPLPLLPARMTLTQSRFVTLKGADRKVLRFPDLARTDDPTRIDDQLVVTVDAQLFLTVLQALPYLVDYPYECTEQTLNRFVSTGIVSAVFQRHPPLAKLAADMAKRETPLEQWNAADPNRRMALEETPWLVSAQGGTSGGFPVTKLLDPGVAKATRETALAKLRRSQTAIGAFPWWEGGPPSPYMTLYIMYGFAKAAEFGVDVPKDMVQRGWQYLAGYVRDDMRRAMEKDCCWEFLTFLNYTASSYPDPSWVNDAITADERKEILDFCFRHWKQHSPYLKGELALTLARMGRPKDAQLVWDSVMDSAKTTEDQGTFWAPEDRSWLWYNDTTETQAFALRTLMELEPNDRKHADGLVQWLLLDKKLSQWKSTRATAEVIYSLVKYLEKENALGVREDATVHVGNVTASWVFEPDEYTGKRNQLVIPGPKIDRRTMSEIVVEKTSPGFEFASATWTFSTEKLPEEERGDFFHVTRTYFRREHKGSEWVLTPLAEGAPIAVGDQLEVHLSLRAKHQAEYVHLRDPRGAGFEPETQTSGWKWDLGLAFYEEVRDSGENFFFEVLPVGEYTFKYRVRAAMAGTFRVAPATVQSMYAPEFHAYSAGNSVEVKP